MHDVRRKRSICAKCCQLIFSLVGPILLFLFSDLNLCLSATSVHRFIHTPRHGFDSLDSTNTRSSACPTAACMQELLDNTAKLREQMAGARALAEREQQEEYLRVKQMEAYERR